MFSVIILTLNEERALGPCLESVRGCDDVVVLDSGSTDGTAALARAAGASVHRNAFVSFAQQRTYADTRLPVRHAWAFHLDADERFTPELFAECAAWPDDAPCDGALAAPRMLFRGHWLRRCTDYPAYQARFVRRGVFRWVDVGHGQREEPGTRLGRLQAPYDHEMMVHGEEEWLAKHRRYAVQEATAYRREARPLAAELRSLRAEDPLLRRRALKRISQRLPGRATLRLLYQYVLRGGFLDGGPAWAYCRLLARYEAEVARAIRRRTRPDHE
jgi:glycosyltransferase involved in cell wall biosynthesis